MLGHTERMSVAGLEDTSQSTATYCISYYSNRVARRETSETTCYQGGMSYREVDLRQEF